MEGRLVEFSKSCDLQRTELPSPMFLCSRGEFAAFAKGKKRLLMGEFYKRQRRKLDILVDGDGQPTGGRWSFDADNRRKLPKDVTPPEMDWAARTDHVVDVIELVAREFADHPGDANEFCWPTTREQALLWLDVFIEPDNAPRDLIPTAKISEQPTIKSILPQRGLHSFNVQHTGALE